MHSLNIISANTQVKNQSTSAGALAFLLVFFRFDGSRLHALLFGMETQNEALFSVSLSKTRTVCDLPMPEALRYSQA